MLAIPIALVWLGYSAGLYGYCLLRGYNVTPKQLLSPTWPPQTAKTGPQGGSGFDPGAGAGGGAGGGGGGSF